MTITIYQTEINDGLESVIRENSTSLAYAKAKVATDSESKSIQKVLASANPNQRDLFYLTSILVSTGWNKNDEVFDKAQSWIARNTPVDKQFNFMHDEGDIIGHITSSHVVDMQGNLIPDNTPIDQLPDDFEIIVGSVLYSAWSDKDRQERMSKIIAGIMNGDWFVSMECLIPDFDYAIITPDNEQKVVARTEDTSFLSKYLKAYGGDGIYQDHKIGRMPKNFLFSGKGLVDNPANERSVILDINQRDDILNFIGTVASVTELPKQEKLMSTEISKTEYDRVVAEKDKIAATLEEIKASNEKQTNERVAALQDDVEALSKSVAEISEKHKQAEELASAKAATIEKLEKDLADAKAELDESKAELVKVQQEKVKAARMQKLLTKDVDEAKAAELIEVFANAPDAQFDALVSSLPEKSDAGDMKKKAEMDDKGKKAKEDKEDEDKAKAATEDADLEKSKASDASLNVNTDKTNEVAEKARAFFAASMGLSDSK